MKKYQCNGCGKDYETFNEAALCHPDVNIIEDGMVLPELPSAQQSVHPTASRRDPRCNCFKNDTLVWEKCPIHGGG